MKGNFKATSALALLGTTSVSTADIKKFGDAVGFELAEIPRHERRNAARAILVGIGMHAMKASVKHGEFTPWLNQKLAAANIWTPATAKLNASYYMRLAIAFVEEAKPSKSEMLALTAAGATMPSLNQADGPAGKLLERVEKFVGEFSLNELLIEHGIKNGGSSGGSAGALTTSGEDPLMADTAAHLMGLRQLLLDPETIKRFTARQLEDIEHQWASGLSEFRKLRAKMGGK